MNSRVGLYRAWNHLCWQRQALLSPNACSPISVLVKWYFTYFTEYVHVQCRPVISHSCVTERADCRQEML